MGRRKWSDVWRGTTFQANEAGAADVGTPPSKPRREITWGVAGLKRRSGATGRPWCRRVRVSSVGKNAVLF